jgi:type II secretory pathway component PulJ
MEEGERQRNELVVSIAILAIVALSFRIFYHVAAQKEFRLEN